jgi:hypothetical protein
MGEIEKPKTFKKTSQKTAENGWIHSFQWTSNL